MKRKVTLIMANGSYGEIDWYSKRAVTFESIYCADGGTNWARRFGIRPDWIIGDMDSIDETEKAHMKAEGVSFYTVSADKDFTDTQLALDVAAEEGASEIVIWGGLGDRLDHTFANLFSAIPYIKKGIDIRFDSPEMTVYLVCDDLQLNGQAGDIVTILSLGKTAIGVTLKRFQYCLENVTLDGYRPIGVSNRMSAESASIRVADGILAVFHMKSLE